MIINKYCGSRHHFLGSFFLFLIAIFGFSSVYATDQFWQSPLSQSPNQASIYSTDAELVRSFTLNSTITSSDFSSDFKDTADQHILQSSFAITQALSGSSSITFEYDNAQEQSNFVVGYTHNNLSLSVIQGSGENYLELGGAYSGVDPYLFHGGVNQQFDYSGYAVDYAANRIGHLQFGQATVQSDGLLDRKARYMEWSNNRVFARLTQFARGSESIGNGFDTGFAFGGNKQFAFQALRLDNGRSMNRIRFQFDGKKSRQYWLDFSTHNNPLFRDNDDYQVMLSFKTLLGANSLVSYADEQTDEEAQTNTKKKGKGLNRAVFIGAGIAAAAGLSSSGSDSQDSNNRLNSQNDAAFEVLSDINPRSVRENREFGGWVFINPDGSYSSTTPVRGEEASVILPDRSLVIPLGSRSTATYHTHAGFDPRFDNENFSPTDLNLNRRLNVDGYLATPGGQFKFHDVVTDQVSTLGSIAN